MKILAIESSCDETAVALVEKLGSGQVKVLVHKLASSGDLHVKTGGVVPEVAARSQLESMTGLLEAVMLEAEKIWQVDRVKVIKLIDRVAVTQGPGLIGSLLVGVETAKSLALAWDKPLIGVNHLVGHIYANWLLDPEENFITSTPKLPSLVLIASGLHCDLIRVIGHKHLELLGQTRDDAAGECFDKCARALGLPYPGGPEIAALAKQARETGLESEIKLPRPLIGEDTLDTSFSGLKAAFARAVEKIDDKDKPALARELEEAIVDVLVTKVLVAARQFEYKSIVLAGGVSANVYLRETLRATVDRMFPQMPVFVPKIKYCTDNAAMIGAAAVYGGVEFDPVDLKADPGMGLE